MLNEQNKDGKTFIGIQLNLRLALVLKFRNIQGLDYLHLRLEVLLDYCIVVILYIKDISTTVCTSEHTSGCETTFINQPIAYDRYLATWSEIGSW